MKNQLYVILTAIGLSAASDFAQAQTELYFTGAVSPISSGGSVIGYSYDNVFGDGSDAILDITVDHSQTSSYYGTTVTDDRNLASPNIFLGTSASGDFNPIAKASFDGTFHTGTTNVRLDFFLHDSSGTALNVSDLDFLVRDIDGGFSGQTVMRTVREGLDFGAEASNIGLFSPTKLVLAGGGVLQTEGVNLNVNDPQGHANLDQATGADGMWSWDLYAVYEEGSDGSGWANLASARGVLVAAPEPSATLLGALLGACLLLKRRRH